MFFGCTTRSNVRMRKLWENEYLDRHYLRPLAFHGSSQAIYSLGTRGVDMVTESLSIDRAEVKRNRDKDCQLNPFFVEHILSVNDFRIGFQEAVERHPELQFERWINERDIQDEYKLHRNGKVIKHRIRPDGYGRYWYEQKLFSFFLELFGGDPVQAELYVSPVIGRLSQYEFPLFCIDLPSIKKTKRQCHQYKHVQTLHMLSSYQEH